MNHKTQRKRWLSLLVALLSGLLLASTVSAGSSGTALRQASAAAKCNVAPGATIPLITPATPQTISSVSLENVQVSAAQSGGVCHLSGILRVVLPGNNVTTAVEGDVDQWDQFLSTSAGVLGLNIAGLDLQANKVTVLPDKTVNNAITYKVALGEATLKVVPELGGEQVDVQVPLRIDQNGLRASDDLVSAIVRNALNIPSLKVPSGLQLIGLFGDLISEANGYKLSVEGQLSIPGMATKLITSGDSSGTATIKARFSIYVNALGYQTIDILPAETPDRIPVDVASVLGPTGDSAANGCFFGPACLSEVGLNLSYKPGINLDMGRAGGTIWLTGVRGSITLTSHDTAINIGVTIETSTISLPGLGTAIRVDGDARLQYAPEFAVGLRAALKMFILEIAVADVGFSESQGLRAGVSGITPLLLGPVALPIRFEGEVRVWGSGQVFYGYNGGPVYIAGSGRAGWYIKTGEIFNSCTWVPCGVRMCTTRVWFFVWFNINYPCGLNWCYSCLNVPPYDVWLGGGTADMGHFKGDIWGLKGTVNFWTWSTGVFFDLTNGRTALGNVNGYVLDAPTVLRTAARLRSGGDGQIPTGTAAQATVLSAESTSLLLRTPVGVQTSAPRQLSAMRDALAANPSGRAALDVITTTAVITQTDTIFSIGITEPLTPSIFLPDNANVPAHLRGKEITQDNYTSYTPELVVNYQEIYTYTQAAAPSDSRWRYLSAALAPLTVTLSVDGTNVRTNQLYISEYMTTTPGLHSLAVTPTDPASLAPAVAQLSVMTGTDTTALLYFNGSNQPALLLLPDSRTPPSQPGRGLVRFVNVLGNRNDNLRLFVNGQLVGEASPGNASAYVEMAAGSYAAEVQDMSNGVVLTGTLDLAAGDHRSLVASSQLLETSARTTFTAMQLSDFLEVALKPLTQKEFQVDQAPVGDWQVKLTGTVTSPTWRLAVLNATNPPILSDFTVTAQPGNPLELEASLLLQSDYSPTKLTFFVARAPITITATMTNTDNSVTTQTIPQFHGEELDSMEITALDELNGSTPIEFAVDLSFLESGTYYVWVQVEDGVSPSVNQYAADGNRRDGDSRTVRVADVAFDPAVQVQNATPVVIDQKASFPGHFASAVITPSLQVDVYVWDTTVCPNPAEDPECKLVDGEWGKYVVGDTLPLYYEWTPSHHPDTDGYIVQIEPLSSPSITATQTFTVGDSVYEVYDENDNSLGVLGYGGWREVAPDSTYRLTVGAEDRDTGTISWSASQAVTTPLGSIGLTTPADAVAVEPGGQVTVTLTVAMSEDIFFPVELEMGLWNLPPGIDADFVAADGRRMTDGRLSASGRMAPTAAPQQVRDRIVSVARVNPDGTPTSRAAEERSNFQQPVQVIITTQADTPEGRYEIPVTIISGPLRQEAVVTVQIGNVSLYLPAINR